MTADRFVPRVPPMSETDASDLAAAFLSGEPEAGDLLFALLSHHAAITARDYLATRGPEIEDIVQDTVVAVLEFLKRRAGFRGKLIGFTITVARNRCRNYLVWRRYRQADSVEDLADYLHNPERGPLDHLLVAEQEALLKEAVLKLDPACRRLLHALYYENRRIEDLQAAEGLKAVQSVYHRRAMCLKKVSSLLKNRLFICSSPGGVLKPKLGKGPLGKGRHAKGENEEIS